MPSRSNEPNYSSLCADVTADQQNSFKCEVQERDPLDDLDLPPIEMPEDFLDLSEFAERSLIAGLS